MEIKMDKIMVGRRTGNSLDWIINSTTKHNTKRFESRKWRSGFKLQDFVIHVIFCCQKRSHILIKFPFATFERWKQWLLFLIIISTNCIYFYAFQYHLMLNILSSYNPLWCRINYWNITNCLRCFLNKKFMHKQSFWNDFFFHWSRWPVKWQNLLVGTDILFTWINNNTYTGNK
jgi:hypothetical protein